jgi:hypothetical protein
MAFLFSLYSKSLKADAYQNYMKDKLQEIDVARKKEMKIQNLRKLVDGPLIERMWEDVDYLLAFLNQRQQNLILWGGWGVSPHH